MGRESTISEAIVEILLPVLFFFFFESTIYYTVLDRSPWQHYVKVAIHPRHML